ncbi:M50 family metallopeptidase [Amycolatopsis suaedae]|uniref:M50 family peptidase n=1 Tax=Amycolatopsis suaedae TaxID=2510978 RepID=A0A4Q7IX90_9PSEU|nr:M50 family metallopeptidase [Amycolatopsis suaedae]RZQ59550.1 M50 family peptidase [Amycolatopsis suaedae]
MEGSQVWELFDAQPDPPGPVALITGAAALVLVISGSPWRLARNLVTIVHEGGHALVALLAGRRLHGIRLHSDTSGVTVSRGKPTGPGMVLTSLAGYPAPALLGLGFAALVAANRISVLLTVAAVLLLGVLVMIRNVYGAFTVVLTAIALGCVAFLAPPGVQAVVVYFITWFLLFGGVRPVFELQAKRRRGAARDSDADQLGRLTGVPALLWVGIMLLVALGSVFVGGSWLIEPALS